METLDATGLAEIRRRQVGTIFQFFHLLPTLTAAENVELPLQLNGVDRARRVERVRWLLDRVKVAHRAQARPGELSGGEMQRIAIARALAHSPALLLADEPTGNLDSKVGKEIMNLLLDLNKESGTTLIIVTHDPTVAEQTQRVIRLRDGLLDGAT